MNKCNKCLAVIEASAMDNRKNGKEINTSVGGSIVDLTQLLAWVVLAIEKEYRCTDDMILSATKGAINYIKERGYDKDE